jgi:hypothetical protein
MLGNLDQDLVTTFVLLVVATSNDSHMLTIARARRGVHSLQQSLKEFESQFNPALSIWAGLLW